LSPRFSTSRQTLTWIPETFFTALLNGRISSLKDETGAIFIDRDPDIFALILNYMRTKEIDFKPDQLRSLRHEAEYYNISPLTKRLILCEEMDHSSCGDLLFYGMLPLPVPPPSFPTPHPMDESGAGPSFAPGSARIVPDQMAGASTSSNAGSTSRHSRNSSWDMRTSFNGKDIRWGHSRTASLDMRHSRNSSADLNKCMRNEIGLVFGAQLPSAAMPWLDHMRVQIIKAHHNWIAVAYAHFVCCYRLKDSAGWQLVFTSPYIETVIERIAINAKMNLSSSSGEQQSKMIAVSLGSQIKLWGLSEDGAKTDVGTFNLNVRVEYLFFIGSQLVALSSSGKIGVWHAMTQHWQIQDLLTHILSFDTAGSFLLLGCHNGSIYYIDMQKFPLRMKDNDLLVTELYKDPNNDHITAISVYLTPKTTSEYG
jgi:BTB/POZ domain-containing protein KCTD3